MTTGNPEPPHHIEPDVFALSVVIMEAGRLASPTAIARAVLAAGYRPPS
jgi:hypothetical protein